MLPQSVPEPTDSSSNQVEGTPFFTIGLIGVLVALFGLVAIKDGVSPSAQYLFEIGGNSAGAFREGQFWRLMTSAMLHGGLAHIAFNCVALWQIGSFLELKAGYRPFITLFVFAALMGSVLSGIFSSQFAVSIGASGGIFGLLSFFTVGFSNTLKEWTENLKRSGPRLLPYFAIGFLIGGVDNFAHFGGILAGLLFGLGYRHLSPEIRNILWILSAGFLILAILKILQLALL